MSELKLPRLLAAAKEFNVGQDTIIDFLAKKGFSKEDLKPTAKLSEEMYFALQAEFQGDKVAKNKADQVEIPKGASGEPKKKRDEEEITFRKEEKKPAAPVAKEEPKVEKIVKVEEVKEVAPVINIKETVLSEPEITKVEIQEIESPKVLNKIDLTTIDSSTRPKKTIKKKEEPVVENIIEEPKKPKGKSKQIIDEIPVAEIKPEQVINESEEDSSPVIENIEIEKITGPKIR